MEALRRPQTALGEKVALALAVSQDASLVFPAHRQFLLDGLLDAALRGARQESDAYKEAVASPALWRLLASLVCPQAPGASITFGKPIVPVLTLFLRAHGSKASSEGTASGEDAVRQSIADVARLLEHACAHQDLFARSSTQYLSDFATALVQCAPRLGRHGAGAKHLLHQAVLLLTAWAHHQSNKKKVLADTLASTITVTGALAPLLSREALSGLIGAFIMSPSTVAQMVASLTGRRDSRAAATEETIVAAVTSDSLPLVPGLLLASFVKASRDAIVVGGNDSQGLASHRLAAVRLFVLLTARLAALNGASSSPSAEAILAALEGLVNVLVAVDISAIQNDTAWSECLAALNGLSARHVDQPGVLLALLKVDLAAVSPLLPQIFAHLPPSSSFAGGWRAFFFKALTALAHARQLDTATATLIEASTHAFATDDDMADMLPLYATLHPLLLTAISKSLAASIDAATAARKDGQRPLCGAGSQTALVLALKFGTMLTAINGPCGRILYRPAVRLCSTRQDAEILSEVVSLLETIMEASAAPGGDDLDWEALSKACEEHPSETISLRVLLRARTDDAATTTGYGQMFSRRGGASGRAARQEALCRFLPLILKEEPALFAKVDPARLPPWMYRNALFWEAIPSPEALIASLVASHTAAEGGRDERATIAFTLAKVITCMPHGAALLSAPMAAKVIELLIEEGLGGHACIACILTNPLQEVDGLGEQAVARLASSCTDKVLLALHTRSLLSLGRKGEACMATIGASAPPGDLVALLRWSDFLQVYTKDCSSAALAAILAHISTSLLPAIRFDAIPEEHHERLISLCATTILAEERLARKGPSRLPPTEQHLCGRILGGPIRAAMDNRQRWSLNASLIERTGDVSSSGATCEMAIAAFVAGTAAATAEQSGGGGGEGELLTFQMLTRFVRAAPNPRALLMEVYGCYLGHLESSSALPSRPPSGAAVAPLRTAGRLLLVFDAFVIHGAPLVQRAACIAVDRAIIETARRATRTLLLLDGGVSASARHGVKAYDLPREWTTLIHHRAACGGENIAAFERTPHLLDGVLALVSLLVVAPALADVGRLAGLLSNLFHMHWRALMAKRPAVILILIRLLRVVPGLPDDETGDLACRKVARAISDFATKRQASLHHALPPLILAYAALCISQRRRAILLPAMAAAVRHLDDARARLAATGSARHFILDPLDKVMAMAKGDDAKVLLKDLVATYEAEYKYRGKA